MFLTLDCETATLPIDGENLTKNWSIQKPLIYDIGWTLIDRLGNVYAERNFIVNETFFNVSVFNTAYYREKRPIYNKMLASGEIVAKNWNEIVELLLQDLQKVEYALAYNATFDFKKAIPFTEKYVQALYSDYWDKWYSRQKAAFYNAGNGEKHSNPNYLDSECELRGYPFQIVDLWNEACEKLLNIDKFKYFCLDNEITTPSGKYFSTNAETCYKFTKNQNDFVESHTSLSDAKIESEIFAKIAAKKIPKPEKLTAFPFQKLGTVKKFIEKVEKENAENVKFEQTLLSIVRDKESIGITYKWIAIELDNLGITPERTKILNALNSLYKQDKITRKKTNQYVYYAKEFC
jgi:hypothetical protein